MTGNPGGPITLAKSAHPGPILLANDTPHTIVQLPYPGGVRSDGDDTSKPLTRCFGQLPDLVVPDDFDVDYDDLASEFNGDIANAERRAARDRYARRTEEA